MKLILGILALTGFLSLGGVLYAQEQIAAPEKISPEMEAKMVKVQAMMTPNENHKVLELLAGNWNYVSRFWMSAGASPEETTGTNKAEMVYGGRFLKQEIKGTWQGQPFEGTSYTGYDNVKQEYVSNWIDSMMTSIMVERGQYDAATKTLKMSGVNSCPMSETKEVACRSELMIQDENRFTYTAYPVGPDGQEFKGMEIQYTRA